MSTDVSDPMAVDGGRAGGARANGASSASNATEQRSGGADAAGAAAAQWPRIAIIGAGFAGVTLAAKFAKAGIRSFTLLERSDKAGGTWRGTYPGIGVDIVSHLYSFPFKRRYDWTRSHATAAELREYFTAVIADFGLRSHMRFNTDVERVVWKESTQTYDIHTAEGEVLEFDVVVSAIGLFHTLLYPTWPGLEKFKGIKFHAAAWEHEHDLAGKRVAIVGTGSTSLQLVPQLQRIVDKLLVFQREPGWALPKPAREYSDEDRRRFMRPFRVELEAIRWYLTAETLIFRLRKAGWINSHFRKGAIEYLEAKLGDRPDLLKAVTPTYPFGGKRPLFDDPTDSFYTALARPNVELIPRAVVSVTEKGVVDADGVEHEVDVLVMSTGYKVTDYLGTFTVEGRDGRDLHEYWHGDPAGFLGITVPSFPNFYMLYGPNTNGGTVACMIAIEANYVLRNIKYMLAKRARVLEVGQRAYDLWDRYVTHINAKTVLHESNNYYKSGSGKIVSEWPNLQAEYWMWTKLLRFAMKPRGRD